jgi:hypothetical protein
MSFPLTVAATVATLACIVAVLSASADAKVVDAPLHDALTCADNELLAQSEKPIAVSACRAIPDMPSTGADDFTTCCNAVSACYQVCGVAKSECDKLAKGCARALCAGSHEKNGTCDKGQRAFLGSSLLRRSTFETVQESACECTVKQAVGMRYMEHIRPIIERAYGPSKPKEIHQATGKAQMIFMQTDMHDLPKAGRKQLLETIRAHLKGVQDPGAADALKAKRAAENAARAKRKLPGEDDDEDYGDDFDL